VATINQDTTGTKLVLRVEDTTTQELHEKSFDLVVLATGMQPNTSSSPVPMDLPYDDYGFIASQNARPGVYAAGCARTPAFVSGVVQDGTAAALKAIQSVVRR
jgi:quinone-modifying oxidoreductase subunit QmoA